MGMMTSSGTATTLKRTVREVPPTVQKLVEMLSDQPSRLYEQVQRVRRLFVQLTADASVEKQVLATDGSGDVAQESEGGLLHQLHLLVLSTSEQIHELDEAIEKLGRAVGESGPTVQIKFGRTKP